MSNLYEDEIVDNITADLEFADVSVRIASRVIRDGEVISSKFHRTTYSFFDDISMLEDRLRGIIELVRAGADTDKILARQNALTAQLVAIAGPMPTNEESEPEAPTEE